MNKVIVEPENPSTWPPLNKEFILDMESDYEGCISCYAGVVRRWRTSSVIHYDALEKTTSTRPCLNYCDIEAFGELVTKKVFSWIDISGMEYDDR
jgi:hypothetical protein